MTIKTKKDSHTLHHLIRAYYDAYNIIHDSKIDETTYFLVVEKFFFRNSSRASLSIVIKGDDYGTTIEAVGSGGGQGLFFKFDWGAKESFERAIPKILDNEGIHYDLV